MYQAFSKLQELPFSLGTDPEFIYLGKEHNRSLSLLKAGLKDRFGISVFLGDPGTGKTALIRHLIRQAQNKFDIGLVSSANLPPSGLLQSILFSFGINGSSKAAVDEKTFLKYLVFQEKSHPRLLIIDDAHYLDVATLKKLLKLRFIDRRKQSLLFRLFLVGRTEFLDILMDPELEQIDQEIELTFQLMPLTRAATRDYIQQRLRISGMPLQRLFNDEACTVIHDYSKGIPGLINNLCGTALVYGYAYEKTDIDAALIHRVASDHRQLDGNDGDTNNALTQNLQNSPALTGLEKEAIEHGSFEKAQPMLIPADNIQPGAKTIPLVLKGIVEPRRQRRTVSEFIVSDVNGSYKSDIANGEQARTVPVEIQEDNVESAGLSVGHFSKVAGSAIVLAGVVIAIVIVSGRATNESDESLADTATIGANSELERGPNAPSTVDFAAMDPIAGSERTKDLVLAQKRQTEIESSIPVIEQPYRDQSIADRLTLNARHPTSQRDSKQTTNKKAKPESALEKENRAPKNLPTVSATPINSPEATPQNETKDHKKRDGPVSTSVAMAPIPSELQQYQEEKRLKETLRPPKIQREAVALDDKQRPPLRPEATLEIPEPIAELTGRIESARHEITGDKQHPTATIHAKLNGPVAQARVFLASDDEFRPYAMFDDGTHGDRVPNDGEFRAEINLDPEKSAGIRYYVTARTQSGKVVYNPANGEAGAVYVKLQLKTPKPSVVINEFMTSNNQIIADPQGDYDDWIELYNSGPDTIDLSGYHLTDDADDLDKWTFPAGIKIPRHGYLLIWADGEPGYNKISANTVELHTNFELSRYGGQILLVGADGTEIIDSVSYQRQKPNISMSRRSSTEGEFTSRSVSTPGRGN